MHHEPPDEPSPLQCAPASPPVPATAGWGERLREAPAVWSLIGLNVLLLLFVEAVGGSNDLRTMLRFGAMPKPLPASELWRSVTSMFLHFGFIHLAFNVWALYVFGPLFERLVGSRRFLALYFGAGLAGSAASASFAPAGSLSAGASGAIFGLLGAFLVLGVRLRATPVGRSFLQQALFLLAINVALGLGDSSIGLAAHLGGFVGGAFIYGADAVVGRRSMTGTGPYQPPPPGSPFVGALGPTIHIAAAAVALGSLAIVASTAVG